MFGNEETGRGKVEMEAVNAVSYTGEAGKAGRNFNRKMRATQTGHMSNGAKEKYD